LDLPAQIGRNGHVIPVTPTRFSELRAAQRAEALLDRGTFRSLTDVTAEAPFVVGSGSIADTPVLIALIDGHVRGGTIGVQAAGLLARLAESLATEQGRAPRPALILGFDTGGVRVEEGPMALAATSAVGVALARLTLIGVRVAAVISGPRGCFGAPAVMAALPERIIMTEDAHWGLTGPRLLGDILDGATPEQEGLLATSAATRFRNGDAHAVVPDEVGAVRAQLCAVVADWGVDRGAALLEERIAASAAVTTTLQARFYESAPLVRHAPMMSRHRDLLRYSFRGQWTPTGPIERRGLVHAAVGTLGERPALGFIIGPEQTRGGVGIEEAALITEMLRRVATCASPERAVILTFLFCQGHAVDFAQERFGLPRALAECLRAMVAARRRGHALVSILGGGTYGAAYLALAAPSHRILAMRGTSVAPMAPEVLRAFETLRGRKLGQGAQLAELIPDIRTVDSVIRLPRVLREELAQLLATVRPEVDAT
jgi:malonate decarboxylase beta subunit